MLLVSCLIYKCSPRTGSAVSKYLGAHENIITVGDHGKTIETDLPDRIPFRDRHA